MTSALPFLRVASLALLVAALVAADPFLAPLLPERLWRLLGMSDWPVRLVPLVAVPALLVLVALPRVRRLVPTLDFRIAAPIALLAAAQMNGFRAGPFDLFDVTLGAIALIWLAIRPLDGDRPVPLPPLMSVLAALLLLSILHLAVQNPVRWFIGTFGIARVALVALLVIDLMRDRAALERMLSAFLWLGVASAVIGIAQFLLSWAGIISLTLITPAETAFKPTPLGFVMRASALCVTAQHYSSFLVYALPFACWRLSCDWRPRHWLAVILLLAGILVSWNFGAMIAAALIGLLFPFLRWPGLALHFALALATAGVLGWFIGLWDLLYALSFGDAGVAKGVSQRHTLFGLGIEKIARNPWVGTGPQGFASYDGNFWGRPVHNAFGQIATELGVLAAVLLGAAYAWLIGRTGLILFQSRPDRDRGLALVLLLMVLAALQLAQSEPNMDHTNTWVVLGLAQAALLVLSRREPGDRL